MRVLLQVPLNPYSGYGRDGIGMARAFLKMGADVHLAPTATQAPLPPELAALLVKEPEAPFDLYIHHVDPDLLDSRSAKKASKVSVAWTMWEYDSFDNTDDPDTLPQRLQNYDALVAYDHATLECFEPYVREDQSLFKLQGGFEPLEWPYLERDWRSKRFGFCMNGALGIRKDPFVAIEAFRQLKEEFPDEFEPAELHLKTSTRGLHPGLENVIPKLRVHYDIWPQDVLLSFYGAQHCLLAPSRGEGKNVPALEFQSTGGVTIATSWGGHREWQHPAYSYGIDYELHPATPETTAKNARASVEHLKQQMLHVFRNRDEAQEKGAKAAEIIPQIASWDTVVEKLLLRLKTEVPGGSELWQKAQFCEREEEV